MSQTFSRNALPGEAPLSRGRSVKTKKYNNEEGSARFFTYEILTGSNAGMIWRMRAANAEYMDNWDSNSEESNYWQKNVGPYIADGSVNGMYMWNYVGEMSHNVDSKDQNHTMALIYKFRDSGEQDFWRFRQRVKKAMVDSGYGSAMNVLWCASGCNGNWVQVRFSHDGYSGQSSDYGDPLTAMVEKYDELYGNDAYEQDGDKVDASLMPEGRRIRHLMLMPEMSSSSWAVSYTHLTLPTKA